MITFVLPISRREWLKPVFDSLENVNRPMDSNLLILVDGDNNLVNAIERRCEHLRHYNIQIVKFGDNPVESIEDRRYRIAAIHNKAKNLIPPCQYVFLIEDDTTYPPDTLMKMVDSFQRFEDAGLIEGVQMGRHKTPYIGAWVADDIEIPEKVQSILPGLEGIEPIDAGGFYCALTEAELYKNHHFEPFDKEGKVGLSSDFNYGLYLRRLGYQNYIDWSILCDHIGEKGSVNLGNKTPVTVEFTRDFKGKWIARTVV